MGSTTPIYAWPFPTGTDRVMDGDNAIEALARAVENSTRSVDSSNIAVTNGVTPSGAGIKVYRRMGVGYVLINANVSGALPAGTLIGTVAAGFRPLTDWRIPIEEYTGTRIVLTTIMANGEWRADTAVGAGFAMYGSSAYPLP